VPLQEPDPDPLEAKKLIDTLCQHLRSLEKEVGNEVPKEMLAELKGYRASLEQCSQGVVDEFTQAKAQFEAAQARAAAQPAPAPPAAPPEEDVLPIGLALRDQLLKRFGVPSKPVAAPAVANKDVWEDLTASEDEQAKAEEDTTKKTMPAGTRAFDADVAVDDDEVAEKPGEKARKPARPQPPATPPRKKPSRPDEKKEIWDTGISEVGE
jgi:hypothetical protein